MNISHNHSVGNSTKLLAIQGTNQLKYLTPDYFLPSSHSESYYSRKYGRSISRISRIVSASLLSAMMLTATLDAKAHPSIEPNPSFLFGKDSAGISANVPLPPIMPQSPPPAPPIPPVPPSMPNLVSDTSIGEKPNNRSAFLESIRNFGKKALKKVKREPKPKVVPSNNGDLMSQLYDTLERRRSGISGEKKSAKPKQVITQAAKLTADEIARKKAENLARAATIREQNKKKWEEAAKKNEEIARERRRAEAEAVKARIEQKARERGDDSSTVIAGIDPILHNNMVADLRQEISSLKEQLTLNSHVTYEGINSVESVNPIRGKRSLEDSKIFDTKDQSTSTEDLIVLEDRLFDEKLENLRFEEDEAVKKLDEVISSYADSDSGYDESLEYSSDTGSNNSLDTNDVVSEIVPQSNYPVSETVQDELAGIEQELQSQKLKEEEVVEAVEDILDGDLITDTVEPADTISPASLQAELARRASIILSARDDLRFGSKAVSTQIRHRLLTRDIGKLVAVSAGDEEESQAPSYSIWGSGTLGGNKQKSKADSNGYSSKIHGGTIGGEINLSHNRLCPSNCVNLESFAMIV